MHRADGGPAALALRAPVAGAAAHARDARRDVRARGRDLGRQRQRDLRRAGDGRPHAVPRLPVLRGGRGLRAARVAGDRPARGRARGVPRAAADGRAGHVRARGRDEPRDGVHRLRAALDPALRAVRDRDAARALARVGPEVPDHRVGRLGDAALRPRVRVRRDGRDELRRGRRGRPGGERRRAAADRHRAGRGRARVQGLGGAVPPVDPGRLRGRADADHRVHGGRDQGGGVRRDHPLLRRRRGRRVRRVGAGAGRARGRDDRGRQRGRDRAVLAQAAARVLVGRAGGLHDRRRGRDHAARDPRGRLLPRGLPADEPGGVRGDRGARARDRAGRRDRVALRARREPAAAGLADDHRDALAGRVPGDGGLLREGHADRRGGRQRLRVARRGDRARVGDLARLLPAGGRGGLDAGARRGGGGQRGGAGLGPGAAGDRGRVGGGRRGPGRRGGHASGSARRPGGSCSPRWSGSAWSAPRRRSSSGSGRRRCSISRRTPPRRSRTSSSAAGRTSPAPAYERV